MSKMKILLYCTKQPHKLYATNEGYVLSDFELGEHYKTKEKLNGKIVAECDVTIFDIHPCVSYKGGLEYGSNCMWATFINEEDLLNKSCLTMEELNKYLASNKSRGYGIGIEKLHIFDEPRKLSDYYNEKLNYITRAPQNMCYAYEPYQVDEINFELDRKILISIRPEWLFKILKGEKIIEVRKKVLKEMIK